MNQPHALLFLGSLALCTLAAEAGPLDDLCKGPRPPDSLSALKRAYDLHCADYWERQASEAKDSQAAAKSAAAQAARDSEAKSLQGLAAELNPGNPAKPDAKAFISLARRHIADLGFDVGLTVGEKLKGSGKSAGRILIIKDFSLANLWLDHIDTTIVSRELDSISALSLQLSRTNCKILSAGKKKAGKKAMRPQALMEDLTVGAEGVNAAAKAALAVAELFRPELLGGDSVQAPDSLSLALLAGLDSTKGPSSAITLIPPIVTYDNSIQYAARLAATNLEAAAGHIRDQIDSLKKGEEFERACAENVDSTLVRANKRFEKLATNPGNSPLGSPIDQASREVALRKSGIGSILELSIITAGGGVTAFQRNRFCAVKLISGADIAVVARLYSTNGDLLVTGYFARSKGVAIPLGEFKERYK